MVRRNFKICFVKKSLQVVYVFFSIAADCCFVKSQTKMLFVTACAFAQSCLFLILLACFAVEMSVKSRCFIQDSTWSFK